MIPATTVIPFTRYNSENAELFSFPGRFADRVTVNELIKPKAVIPTHANEEATKGGKVKPGSKTAKFMKLVNGIPVHLPLSGKTMEFDGDAKCVSGC